jgi:hypothetical protein
MIGLLLLAAAFIFVVYDGTKSIAANAIVYTKASEAWAVLHATSLAQFQPLVERTKLPWLWDPVAVTILDAPAAAVLGVVGAVFMLLGRRPKPLIGYDR